MGNSNKGITMAEKRVGEMNKLTQGLLEQSNRYFQQRNQPQSMQSRPSPQNMQFQSLPSAPSRQNVPNQNNGIRNFVPNGQDRQRQNVPFRNNISAPNTAQSPRFEAVGNGGHRNPQQPVPPPRPEPTNPPRSDPHERTPNKHEPLLPISLNSDTALIAALAAVLIKENADTKLILALLYILM